MHEGDRLAAEEPAGPDKPGKIGIEAASGDLDQQFMFRKAGKGGYYMINLKYSCRVFYVHEGEKFGCGVDEANWDDDEYMWDLFKEPRPLGGAALEMIEEEKEVKPEERCGLAWLRGISYGWGKNLDACNPFKNGDSFRNRFPGTCFHTGTVPPEGPTWKLNFPEEMKITRVEILNRVDCCSGRLANNKVIVGDQKHKGIKIGKLDGRGGWQSFSTDMVGTYVKV